MKKTPLSDYNYHLPEGLIAQTPLQKRDESKFLRIDPKTKTRSHHHFKDITSFLKKGDVLVLNNSKVINARLKAQRQSGAAIEVFLIQKNADDTWQALIKKSKRLKEGETLSVNTDLSITLVRKNPDGIHTVQLKSPDDIYQALEKYGETPLPPYIHTQESRPIDPNRYQTVYAKTPGAVAAPTAGLHFNDTLLKELSAKGIQIETITLHVGYGTFKPIDVDSIEDHVMHEEHFHIDTPTAKRLNTALADKRRIIAVGTTSTRTLESAFHDGQVRAGQQKSSLFIYPGYTFNVISGLITNFHLPKSTLLCLVAALIGRETLLDTYQEAIEEQYRFYSFGDAMGIL